MARPNVYVFAVIVVPSPVMGIEQLGYTCRELAFSL